MFLYIQLNNRFLRICTWKEIQAGVMHVLVFGLTLPAWVGSYLNSAQLGAAEVDMLLAFGLLRKAFLETGGSFPPQDEQGASGFSIQLASPELSI